MEKYKDILRYLNIGISQNKISKILNTSRNTVRKIKIVTDAILDRSTPEFQITKINGNKLMQLR